MARALHWALALGLIAQIAFGLALDEIAPRGTPLRGPVINLHKSIGIVLGLLVLARLGWRLTHRPPRWPRTVTAARQRAATWGHRLLYVCMVALPLSGYIASNFSKHGVKFFGSPVPPWGPNLPPVYAFFNGLHQALGWTLAALVLGHVAMALVHRRRGDGVFERMGPSRSGRS